MFISLLTCNYLVYSPQIKALSEHRVFKINKFKEKYSVNDLKRQTRYLKHLFFITHIFLFYYKPVETISANFTMFVILTDLVITSLRVFLNQFIATFTHHYIFSLEKTLLAKGIFTLYNNHLLFLAEMSGCN